MLCHNNNSLFANIFVSFAAVLSPLNRILDFDWQLVTHSSDTLHHIIEKYHKRLDQLFWSIELIGSSHCNTIWRVGHWNEELVAFVALECQSVKQYKIGLDSKL